MRRTDATTLAYLNKSFFFVLFICRSYRKNGKTRHTSGKNSQRSCRVSCRSSSLLNIRCRLVGAINAKCIQPEIKPSNENAHNYVKLMRIMQCLGQLYSFVCSSAFLVPLAHGIYLAAACGVVVGGGGSLMPSRIVASPVPLLCRIGSKIDCSVTFRLAKSGTTASAPSE